MEYGGFKSRIRMSGAYGGEPNLIAAVFIQPLCLGDTKSAPRIRGAL